MANNDPYGGGYQGYAGQSYAGYGSDIVPPPAILGTLLIAHLNGRSIPVGYVRFTSILLKNSNFCVDHNSGGRRKPRRKIP